MNKIAKKIVFGVLLVASSFIGINSLSAVTIIETTKEDTELNQIADNTIIIGSTKFEEGYVLSALRIAKAVSNDIELNKDNPDYEGVEIFNYFMGDWYKYNEDNTTVYIDPEVEDNTELLSELNNQAIYYVNNVEKVLEVPCNIEAEQGYKIETTTDRDNKKVTIEDGVMKVPATVKTVEVAVVKEGEPENKVVVQTITKENNDNASTEFVQTETTKTYVGSFERTSDKIGGETLKAEFSGSVVTFDGNISYYRNKAIDTLAAGNRVGVKINAPKGFKTDDISKTEVMIGEVKQDVTFTGNDTDGYYFNWYPLVKEGTNRSYAIKVIWAEGISQTFTVKVTDASTLVSAPQGKIEGGTTYGDTVSYSTNGNTITISGKLDYAKADASNQNGRAAGNYAAVKISAPDGFTKDFLLDNATVQIDTRDAANWKNIIYGDESTYFVYYPRFEKLTDTHTVTITWENGNTQVFTIKLDQNNTTLSDPYKGTLEGVASFDSDVKYTVDGNKITVDGILSWTNSNMVTTGVAGNYAAVKFNAPVGYIAEDYAKATVSVDGGVAADWTPDYVYYASFGSSVKEHTVVITWQNGNSQTFTVELGSDAKLLAAPSGTVEGVKTDDVTYSVNDKTVTVGGTLKYDLSKAGNYASVKFTAPSKYKNNLDNVVVKIDDNVVENTFSSEINSNDYAFKFDDEVKEHIVTITWENGNTEVYTIKLDSNATLERSVIVTNETDFRKALNDKNIININVGSSFDIKNDAIEFGVNRDMVVDFGGNTITSYYTKQTAMFVDARSNGSTLTLKNGKLYAPNYSESGLLQVGDKGLDISKAVDFNETTVELASDFTLESEGFGLVVLGTNVNVDIYGKIIVNGEAYAISGNYSSAYLQEVTVNIYDGALVSSEKDTAIYMPSYINLNIYGGEVTGKGVIGIKLGNLNIEGGTLTATGEKTADAALKKTGNGFNATGDVIYVEVNDIYYSHYQKNNNTTDQVLNITISDKANLVSKNANIIRELNLTGDKLVYNTDLTKVFSDRNEVTTYNNVEANVSVNGVKYTSKDLQRAIDEAGNNAKVKLLTDVTLDDLLIIGGLGV